MSGANWDVFLHLQPILPFLWSRSSVEMAQGLCEYFCVYEWEHLRRAEQHKNDPVVEGCLMFMNQYVIYTQPQVDVTPEHIITINLYGYF